MTEAEWMVSADPEAMLQHFATTELPGLLPEYRKLSDRKLRLFACACIESKGRLKPYHDLWAEDGVERTGDSMLRDSNETSLTAVDWAMQWANLTKDEREGGKIGPQRAAFLRDICGNPWRRIVRQVGHGGLDFWPLVPASGLGMTDTIRRIAQSIYEERNFDLMPILADALEDAGADNEEVLRHCRGDSPHVRGCWVLDLILGKE